MAKYTRSGYKVDLAQLHAVWSANYLAINRLLPQLQKRTGFISEAAGPDRVEVSIVEQGSHTDVVDIRQTRCPPDEEISPGAGDTAAVPDPFALHFRLRVYHDARMAEVIASGRHRFLKPRYEYPNPKMYLPDEKYQVNCLFSDWLKSRFALQQSPGPASTSEFDGPTLSKITPRD